MTQGSLWVRLSWWRKGPAPLQPVYFCLTFSMRKAMCVCAQTSLENATVERGLYFLKPVKHQGLQRMHLFYTVITPSAFNKEAILELL